MENDDEFRICPKEIPTMPKELVMDEYNHINGCICPSCGEGIYLIYFRLYNYCPYCGQRFLWPEYANTKVDTSSKSTKNIKIIIDK